MIPRHLQDRAVRVGDLYAAEWPDEPLIEIGEVALQPDGRRWVITIPAARLDDVIAALTAIAAGRAGEGRIMIAAIGTDGIDPVVWGLGETEESAAADARRWCDDDGSGQWDSGGSAYVEVSDALAERIRAGTIHCATLGIEVSLDRDGRVTGATLAQPETASPRIETALRPGDRVETSAQFPDERDSGEIVEVSPDGRRVRVWWDSERGHRERDRALWCSVDGLYPEDRS